MFGRHERNITAVAFAKDGKTLASGDEGGMVRIWCTSTGKMLREFKAYSAVHALAFAPHNRDLLVVVGASQSFYGWDITTGRIIRGFHGHQGENVLSLSFAPDGKLLASGGEDKTIRLWNLEPDRETVAEIAKLEGHKNGIGALAFSPNGRLLASGGRSDPLRTADRSVRIWDLTSGRQLQQLEGHTRI